MDPIARIRRAIDIVSGPDGVVSRADAWRAAGESVGRTDRVIRAWCGDRETWPQRTRAPSDADADLIEHAMRALAVATAGRATRAAESI